LFKKLFPLSLTLQQNKLEFSSCGSFNQASITFARKVTMLLSKGMFLV
jgi:hypothetical protein